MVMAFLRRFGIRDFDPVQVQTIKSLGSEWKGCEAAGGENEAVV